MIRDTFEANPGLCELFKRKIIDRAQSAGLSKDMIDFDSRIDMKGTFHDNLRTFYREYPQLAQDSDYFRLKSPRSLSGVVLEQSWLSYERSNGRTERPEEARLIVPQLTITYTVGRESPAAREEVKKEPETISGNAMLAKVEMNQTQSNHSELVRLLLDRVTAIAGESVTQTILHQIGREIGLTAFDLSRNQTPAGNLVAALDHALRDRGLGRVVGLEEIDHRSSVTYVCTIEECRLCRKGAAATSTCSVMRGMVTRWFESHLRKKAESIEGACVDANSHLCVFRVKFKK
jgi:predicted hydrocarbon binding protein